MGPPGAGPLLRPLRCIPPAPASSPLKLRPSLAWCSGPGAQRAVTWELKAHRSRATHRGGVLGGGALVVSQEPGEGAVQPGLRTLDQRERDLRMTQGKGRASHGDCVVTTRWRPAGGGEGLLRALPCRHPRLTQSPRGAHCLCLSGRLDSLRVKLGGAGCPASVPSQGPACVYLHGETSDQPAFQPSPPQGPGRCGSEEWVPREGQRDRGQCISAP